MNDDMERRLRELFEDKATDSAAASRAPEPVVKRARRRQVGTIAVSVVTVIALAGVSFAGIRTLNGTGERGLMPADISPYDSGRYPVFERTAVIESLSVTSPSDWYLVNQWPLGTQIANQTEYQYGYLYEADTLCYWLRERVQVNNLLTGAGDEVPGCVLFD